MLQLRPIPIASGAVLWACGFEGRGTESRWWNSPVAFLERTPEEPIIKDKDVAKVRFFSGGYLLGQKLKFGPATGKWSAADSVPAL